MRRKGAGRNTAPARGRDAASHNTITSSARHSGCGDAPSYRQNSWRHLATNQGLGLGVAQAGPLAQQQHKIDQLQGRHHVAHQLNGRHVETQPQDSHRGNSPPGLAPARHHAQGYGERPAFQRPALLQQGQQRGNQWRRHKPARGARSTSGKGGRGCRAWMNRVSGVSPGQMWYGAARRSGRRIAWLASAPDVDAVTGTCRPVHGQGSKHRSAAP
jgi:hypothetical protein